MSLESRVSTSAFLRKRQAPTHAILIRHHRHPSRSLAFAPPFEPTPRIVANCAYANSDPGRAGAARRWHPRLTRRLMHLINMKSLIEMTWLVVTGALVSLKTLVLQKRYHSLQREEQCYNVPMRLSLISAEGAWESYSGPHRFRFS